MITAAEVLNFAEVVCPLTKTLDKFFSKNGIPSARLSVSLSNGKKFSTDALPVTVYDSRCMTCDEKCKGQLVKCRLKVRYVNIKL